MSKNTTTPNAARDAGRITEQSAEHTPGPWEARPSDLNPARLWITQASTAASKIVPVIAFASEGNPDHEANARLIAAAPELLAALKELVEVGRTVLSPVHDSGAVKGRTDHEILVAACAAIAKAKGGE